jgi:hypothetical protein
VAKAGFTAALNFFPFYYGSLPRLEQDLRCLRSAGNPSDQPD